jgi:hypothetical protein
MIEGSSPKKGKLSLTYWLLQLFRENRHEPDGTGCQEC